ncbi:MAG TPA: quinone oxidoreductase [Actinopolymorphaceae bacterium]
MRAIQVREYGGPDVLTLVDVPAPVPGPREALISVAAAGVNYIDTYHRSGQYPVELPFVLGSEGAGTVQAVGEEVTEVAVGDRVAWSDGLGSYAEQAVVPADRLVPIPEGISEEVAAASLLQGATAHYLVTSTYAIQPGDWALVHAAAGGVGLLLTQMIKMRGGNVLATVSTPEKAELAKQAGADEIATYDDFAQRARSLTGGEGFPVVYDGVGRATFEASLDALRPRGMMVLYGASSGQVPPIDPQVLNRKGSLFLTRPTLGHYTRDRAELMSRAHDVFAWVASGRLKVRIGGRYSLEEARLAHEDLQGRRSTGKLVLMP